LDRVVLKLVECVGDFCRVVEVWERDRHTLVRVVAGVDLCWLRDEQSKVATVSAGRNVDGERLRPEQTVEPPRRDCGISNSVSWTTRTPS
jgi:hypothetical protein